MTMSPTATAEEWLGFDYSDAISLKNLPFVIRCVPRRCLNVRAGPSVAGEARARGRSYDAASDHRGILQHKDNADVSFVLLLSEPDDFEVRARGRDRASPKQSSPKIAFNWKTLYSESQKCSFLTPDWSAP
jgi:hypothetical protein